MSAARAIPLPSAAVSRALLSLTKPDVTFLVVLTTGAGVYLASPGTVNPALLVHAIVGTTLISAGTSALNHYFERDSDALMRRTSTRPIPAGLLAPESALWFGVTLALAGAVHLTLFTNWLSALLGLATSLTYLGIYTPLKTRTSLATLIGAFPGAVPPLIGWAAARGSLSLEALALYAILFAWQFPHFLAIAWMYREDYARAGILMLPVVDKSGDSTFRQIIAWSAALVPVSLLPATLGMAGPRYLFFALVLSLALLLVSWWSARERSNYSAKWLMHATVVYIPVLLGVMMFDKVTR